MKDALRITLMFALFKYKCRPQKVMYFYFELIAAALIMIYATYSIIAFL